MELIKIMRELVYDSVDFRKNTQHYNLINNNAYIHELCTIRLGTHRRAGHTTTVINFALEAYENPAFIYETMIAASMSGGNDELVRRNSYGMHGLSEK